MSNSNQNHNVAKGPYCPTRIRPFRAIARLGVFAVLLAFGNDCSFGEIIPSERRTTWNPGILGGIPKRTTICATLSPSGGEDSGAIQAAIDACPDNQVVKLAAGDFILGGPIRMRSNKVLRGTVGESNRVLRGTVGESRTRLIVRSVNGHPYEAIMFQADSALSLGGTYGPFVGATAGYTKGSVCLTVSNASGISVGNYLLLAQADADNPHAQRGGCTWDKIGPATGTPWPNDWGSLAQIVKVTAKTGNVLTLESPIHYDFSAIYQPKVMVLPNVIENAGVEDLYITRESIGAAQGAGIIFRITANCWAYNVELEKTTGRSLKSQISYRNNYRKMFVHEAFTYGSGGSSYGISLGVYSTDVLLDDSISWYFNAPFVTEACGPGNVVAYSFFEGGWLQQGNNPWATPGMTSHCGPEFLVLLEGNITNRISADSVHGGTYAWTVFRNYLTTDNQWWQRDHLVEDIRYRTGFHLAANGVTNHGWNYVGNVIGGPPSIVPLQFYIRSSADVVALEPNSIVGLPNDAWITAFVFDQSSNYFESYIHGNWDSANDAVSWWDNNADHTIPASLYLSAQPSWWPQGVRWPLIGSDLTPMQADSPAFTRFKAWHAANRSKNVAKWIEGSTITVSSIGPNSGAALELISGEVHGWSIALINGEWVQGLEESGFWKDGTPNTWPDWVEINFNQSRTIDQITINGIPDGTTGYGPWDYRDFTRTGTQHLITDFTVEYWDGSAWATVPGGAITGNNLVARRIMFEPITTKKIKLTVNAAQRSTTNLVEIEAWSAPTNRLAEDVQ